MFQNGIKNRSSNLNMVPFDHFEHMMGICAGLVGPKSENVEKALVLLLLFEGSRAAGGRQEDEQRSDPRR